MKGLFRLVSDLEGKAGLEDGERALLGCCGGTEVGWKISWTQAS